MNTLEGVRVVDISSRYSAAWCSRLLAHFGAQVIMLSDTGDHRALEHSLAKPAPFDSDGNSIPALYGHANKQFLQTELGSDDAKELIRSAA